MKFILIIIMHVGSLGSGNSNSITTAEFSTLDKCNKAGNEASKLVKGTTKVIEFTCQEK